MNPQRPEISPQTTTQNASSWRSHDALCPGASPSHSTSNTDTHCSYLLHPRCIEAIDKLGNWQNIHMVSLTYEVKNIVVGRAKWGPLELTPLRPWELPRLALRSMTRQMQGWWFLLCPHSIWWVQILDGSWRITVFSQIRYFWIFDMHFSFCISGKEKFFKGRPKTQILNTKINQFHYVKVKTFCITEIKWIKWIRIKWNGNKKILATHITKDSFT